ncbi:hypothetical protein SLEP1_g46197 [Rubroshorea leprosula]|uniref:Enoyl reductase (ER) domain-containing protein n=1 Tax=Rubroshorea leprosula TaxID=152421 RepID=A0AAV5LLH0_9ROSI|nr:hypothetical protein SLEP1_g46197 [Rubroshorea leprosula]
MTGEMASHEAGEMMVENREWVLKEYVSEGLPTSHHLKLQTAKLSTVPDGHLMFRILWISVDPYTRTQMTGREEGLYAPQFELNQAARAFAIGEVIQSKDVSYSVGDIVVIPFCPVAEYCVKPADLFLRKIDPTPGVSELDYLTALGVPGFAAWVGIVVLGDPKPGENVFISAAAGGVGVFAGQLAKLRGCRVVGSTGSDEKVKFLKEELGYDEAFNYKTETDFDAALAKYFPNGIDIYLDNVGGKMLEAVLNHVNVRARIPLCGMISQYNKVWTEREGVRNLLNMVGKDVRMEGFMIGSYLHRFGEFMEEVIGYLKEGKMSTKQKIYHGIESFLESICSLFTGSNAGKVVIQVNKPMKP